MSAATCLETTPHEGECWHSTTTQSLRVLVVAYHPQGRRVEYRRRTRGPRPNPEAETLNAFLDSWEPCDGGCRQLEEAQDALGEEDDKGLTPRQVEVAGRPVTPYLLAELQRERPRGGCIVCWRNIRRTLTTEPPLACNRKRPGRRTSWCQVLVAKAQRSAARAQARAKESLFQEGAQP